MLCGQDLMGLPDELIALSTMLAGRIPSILLHAVCALAAIAFGACVPAHAQTEIQWWHSMSAALGDWVNDLA